MGLDRFAGHGWFVGPAIYVRLSEQAWISVLWNTQVAGRAAGEVGSLDLANFERHLVQGAARHRSSDQRAGTGGSASAASTSAVARLKS